MNVFMIILINGAFGAGKTTTATRLAERIENAMIFDPEEVGFMLRAIIPKSFKKPHEQSGDFQDLDLWRVLVVQTLTRLKEQYGCHFIVPMTLCNKSYCDYIVEGMKAIDSDFYHVYLKASAETINKRLVQRGETPGTWPFQQAARCLSGLDVIEGKIEINTDSMGIDEVIKTIEELLHMNGSVYETVG